MFQSFRWTPSQASTSEDEDARRVPVVQCHPLTPRVQSDIAFDAITPPNSPAPPGARVYGSWCTTVPIRLPQTSPSAMELGQIGASSELLPSYDAESDPAPAYTRLNERPETLARYLFRYGFLCPIFWGFGAAILFWDLNPLPRVIDGKSAAEQAEELSIMRATELKWACRSLYALIVFSAVVGSFVVALYATGSGPFAP